MWQVEKLEDSFELINSRPKPLAAYLFSRNKKLEEEFVQKVSAGGILINDVALHVRLFFFPFQAQLLAQSIRVFYKVGACFMGEIDIRPH